MRFRFYGVIAGAMRAAMWITPLALACLVSAQPIRLRSTTFDPLDIATQTTIQRAQLQALETTSAKLLPGERRLQILQWSEALTEATLAQWTRVGIERVAPLPEQAWIVTVPAGMDLRGALRAAGVPAKGEARWISALATDWKLAPDLIAKRVEAGTSISGLQRFHVQLADTGVLKQARELVAARGARMTFHSRQKRSEVWTIEATWGAMLALAEENAVLWIEAAPLPELNGERAALFAAGLLNEEGSCVSLPGGGSYAQWLAATGLSGAGQIAHMMDDGLSQGNASNQPGTAHPDLVGRIAGIDNATVEPNGESIGGHGNINASILMGQPNAAGGMRDAGGYLLGQGVAPEATIFATRIFDDSAAYDTQGRTLQQLVTPAWQAGARISSNSWNAVSFGQYTADSLEIDSLTRDIDTQTSGDQAMLFVFSAGNSRNTGSIGSPASAKSIVTVGALENCDAGVTDGCGHDAVDSDDMRDVAVFQSRGPMADGRLGPTLTAPGVHITGAASDSPRYNGQGVCGREEVEAGEPPEARAYYPAFQNLYTYSSGTSHSTPVVAGAAVLLREFLQREYGIDPSPALLKGALVSGTTDPVGGRLNDGSPVRLGFIPNNHVGWGRANLARVIDPSSARFFVDQSEVLTPLRSEFKQELQVTEGGTPLRIVLSWTDAIGALNAARAMVNDLDLELTDGVRTWRGNVFADGHSAEGGEADRLNTLEVIEVQDPLPGIYTLTVRAANLLGDGVPNVAGGLDQDFALFTANGSGQTSLGKLELDRTTYTCAERVVISLSDFDLRGVGQVDVLLQSEGTGDVETVTLMEQGSGSGLLRGEMQLTAEGSGQAGDGTLTTADGNTLRTGYLDMSPGENLPPSETVATARMDCAPPRIVRQVLVELTAESALFEIETDEPSRLTLRYGLQCEALDRTALSVDLTTTHRVRLSGLPACALIPYRVELSDGAGNAAADGDEDEACLLVQTLARETIYAEPLNEGGAPGWTHAALTGEDAWVLGESGLGAGALAWRSAAAEGVSDTVLMTPPVALGGADQLTFLQRYDFEAIGLHEGFDGGVIEITSDGGASWSDLGPWITEGRYNTTLAKHFGNPLAGRAGWSGVAVPQRVVVELGAFAGRTVQVRFRLGTDRSMGGAGWEIDEIAFGRDVYCLGPLAGVSPEAEAFSCAAESIRVMISDSDLAAGTWAQPEPGSILLAVEGEGEPVPVEPESVRRIDDAGVFEVELGVAAAPGGESRRVAGAVDVIPGQRLAIFYDDPATPFGPRRASNSVRLDCAPPYIVSQTVESVSEDRAVLRVEASEPVRVEVGIGTACGVEDQLVASPQLASVHLIPLTGLNACTAYYYRLRLTDAAGNVQVPEAQAECHGFKTTLAQVWTDTLEPQPAGGWSTGSAGVGNGWVVSESPLAASPVHAWVITGESRVHDTWLIAPAFNIDAHTELSFAHTFELEAGFDGGVLEISTDGGATWSDLGTRIVQGGYNATLAEDFGNPLEGRAVWSGGVLGEMQTVRIGLGEFAGEARLVRFRLGCDRTGGGGRWLIDDLRIEGAGLCGAQFPGAPVPVYPEAELKEVEFAPVLAWTMGVEATQSVAYFGEDPASLSVLTEVEAPAASVATPPLKAGTRYYWRVVSRNAQGSAAGPLWSFRTREIAPTAIADYILGKAGGLGVEDADAVDYNDNGKIEADDLVTAIERIQKK